MRHFDPADPFVHTVLPIEDLLHLRRMTGYGVPEVQRIHDAGFTIMRRRPEMEPELADHHGIVRVPPLTEWPGNMTMRQLIHWLGQFVERRRHDPLPPPPCEGPTGHGGGWFGGLR